jgi:tRNA nucleotidyltransferase (CCA-adding enzyme)
MNENVWVGKDGRLYSVKERKEYDVFEILKRTISFKYKYKLEFETLKEVKDDPWLHRFLRKTPSWLK